MTALANIRPQPIVRETFEMLRLADDGRMWSIGDRASFDEALEHATATSIHKDRFVIRVTDIETGRVTLHIYAIRQGKPVWRHVDHQPKRIVPLKAEKIVEVRL